jgi:hypothetical protein
MLKSVFAAAGLACCALGAQAGVNVVAGNPDSATFLSLATIATAADVYTASVPYIRLAPAGAANRPYVAVGYQGGQNNNRTTTVNLSALPDPVTYVSFLWGSPDTFNHVSVVTDDSFSYEFGNCGICQSVPLTFNSSNGSSAYIGFQLDGIDDLEITSLVFSIDGDVAQNAFEVTDFSVTAVPEPETYALMLAGLGVVGFMARRRKAA